MNNSALTQTFIESAAGFVAGVASTLITHPLDVIKTRLQGKHSNCLVIPLIFAVDRVSPTSSIRTVRDIIRSNEGAVTAFYRGLSPNLVGNSVSWSLYFACYARLKSGLQTYHGQHHRLSYYDFFLASGAAGRTPDLWLNNCSVFSDYNTY